MKGRRLKEPAEAWDRAPVEAENASEEDHSEWVM